MSGSKRKLCVKSDSDNTCLSQNEMEIFVLNKLQSKELSKNKKIKLEKLIPIVFPKIHKPRTLGMTSNIVKCLIDSGATGTIIDKRIAKGLPKVLVPQTQWTTAAGQINTSQQVKVNFSLPEFDEDKTIAWQCHVTDMSKLN